MLEVTSRPDSCRGIAQRGRGRARGLELKTPPDFRYSFCSHMLGLHERGGTVRWVRRCGEHGRPSL